MLEQEAGAMLGFDVVQGPNGATNQVAQALADQAELALLHMVTVDPTARRTSCCSRTPIISCRHREKH
jgi:hypothetical protein